MEELFYRGYCQRRLAEDWGHGPAIIGTGCLFLFGHSQYLMLNAYNISLMASLLVLALGLGVVFAWTRSLVPSFVAHAIINVPMTPLWQGVFLVACLCVALAMSRRAVAAVKNVFTGARVPACLVLAAVGIGYAIAAQRLGFLIYVAAAMLGLAVAFESMDRRHNESR
jgi:hypothetical protein